MIKGFISYINEGYINNIPHDNVDTIKYELIDFLDEFRDGILKSIKYDTKSQKVTSVKNIDISKVIDDLKEEFDSNFIDELNIDAFLRKIYQILELKKRNTKKIIKDEFIDYYISLDRRLSKDTVGDDINKYDDRNCGKFKK